MELVADAIELTVLLGAKVLHLLLRELEVISSDVEVELLVLRMRGLGDHNITSLNTPLQKNLENRFPSSLCDGLDSSIVSEVWELLRTLGTFCFHRGRSTQWAVSYWKNFLVEKELQKFFLYHKWMKLDLVAHWLMTSIA